MKRKIFFGIFCFILATMLLFATAAASRQAVLSGKLIRLHVLADSDTPSAQADKLAVRDAVLNRISEESWQSRAEAEAWLRAHTQELSSAAEACLTERGCTAPVTVQLGAEGYPTRQYDTFSLPAGEYLSLRIRIGSGAGHNWWCVIYPNLCLPTAEDSLQAIAASAGFTDAEYRLITENSDEIQIKFKVLEWLESAREWLASQDKAAPHP